MEFGVFYQLPCAVDQTPAARLQDTIAQCQLADELGFDAAWLAELHFNPRFSVMPAPLMIASIVAQTTKRIRIGNAVNLLPLHQLWCRLQTDCCNRSSQRPQRYRKCSINLYLLQLG